MEIFVMLWVVEVVVAAKEKLNGPGSKNSRLDVNEPSSKQPHSGQNSKKCLNFSFHNQKFKWTKIEEKK